MHHPFRHRKALARTQLDRSALQVNDEAPIDDVEKLVLVVVFMPVELALHDAEPHDAIVYSAQRLVVPGLLIEYGA